MTVGNALTAARSVPPRFGAPVACAAAAVGATAGAWVGAAAAGACVGAAAGAVVGAAAGGWPAAAVAGAEGAGWEQATSWLRPARLTPAVAARRRT